MKAARWPYVNFSTSQSIWWISGGIDLQQPCPIGGRLRPRFDFYGNANAQVDALLPRISSTVIAMQVGHDIALGAQGGLEVRIM